MGILIWIILGLVVLMVLYLAIGTYVALTLTKVGDHPQYSDDPGTFGVSFETVKFESREDRLKISAWYIQNEDSERSLILVHGKDASKQNAISGQMPKLAAALHKEGYALLMIDLRGHGGSEGSRYTWGVRERNDVLGGVDFLLDQGFSPGNIGVLGISLGGAAVIGAAACEKAIGALVVESTFADLNDLVKPNWKKETHLPLVFIHGVYWMWNNLYHFDLRRVKPYEEIARVHPRPVLIMHCKEDEVVSVANAHKLKEANPEAELVLFENCSHAEIFRDHPHDYLDALIPFLNEKWTETDA